MIDNPNGVFQQKYYYLSNISLNAILGTKLTSVQASLTHWSDKIKSDLVYTPIYLTSNISFLSHDMIFNYVAFCLV